MPLFRVQIFKQLAGSDREWSNTYLLLAATLADAVTGAAPIPGREQVLHGDNVTLTRMRVSDIVVGTDVFSIVPLGVIGTAFAADTVEWLPLFNCVRVDIQVTGGGRPSRKYYRPPIWEPATFNSQLNGSIKTLFDGAVAGMITDVDAAGASLVDPDEQAWLSPDTQLPVAMHQLHRKRKKTAPAP